MELPLTEQKNGAKVLKEGPPLGKGASRIPVRGLCSKRPATSENEAPQPLRKRARRSSVIPPVKREAAAASQPRAPPPAPWKLRPGPGRAHPSSRAAGAAGPLVAPCTAAPAPAPLGAGGNKKKTRPAWDLKGQLSDLRAEVGLCREKVRGLEGANGALQHQVDQLQAALGEATTRASTLSVELQASQEEARASGQRASELSARQREQEEALHSQALAIRRLEAVCREAEQTKEELVARLEAREASLSRAEEGLAEQRAQRAALETRVAALEQELHNSEMERRRLHNAVQELKGNIRVFCRVRPLLPWEAQARKGVARLQFPPEDKKSLVLSKTEESHTGRERKEDVTYEFHFDRVFPPASSQADVFEEISLLVQSALDGYHVCIFAYGQTGSGKTYTMEGPDERGPEAVGMIPRAVRQIFQTARDMEAKGWKYQFRANFLEIYNESLRDLLLERPEQSPELEIRRVSQLTEELHVPNLSYVPVASEQEVQKLLQRAKAQRSVARTNLNEHSSRSHSLFQLHIEGQNGPRELHTSSVLSLVDLAGSERLDKSLSKGERLKETQAINSSLSNLGLVILALSNKEAHIPYRNSKLTYLLQNSLGGSSKMLMFVNISPLEENFGETLSSLRFARKVNECVIGTASTNRK